jgi:hypothetical protein
MMKELQGKGKRLQRKGKAGNMTAAIPAIPPPPCKESKDSNRQGMLFTYCNFLTHLMNSYFFTNSYVSSIV